MTGTLPPCRIGRKPRRGPHEKESAERVLGRPARRRRGTPTGRPRPRGGGPVSGLLYLPALQFGWVWDDATLAASHGAAGAAAGGFHPVLALLQRGEWYLGAGNPALFHFTNLILHAVGVWLVFRLARHLGASPGIAFVASLLFGFHPVHVESVAFVSGRGSMTATVAAIAAILAARAATHRGAEGRRSLSIYAAYALYALAVFSNEIALVVPFLLAGLDRWGAERVPFERRLAPYTGFLSIWAVAILLRFRFGTTETVSLAARGLPLGHPFRAVLLSAGDYLKMLAWPSPLNAIRSLDAATAASNGALLAAIALAAAVALFVLWRRRDPLARGGALVLALGLVAVLPYRGEWNSSPFAAERLAYLPAVGFVLLLASLVTALRHAFGSARGLVTGLALLVAGFAAYATSQRIPVWRDNVSLLQASAATSPHDPEPYLELAEHHAALGDPLAALAALDKAIERDSTRGESYSRRALVLGSLGRWPEAEASARRATRLAPSNAEAWANLGDALAQQGKTSEAVEASRRAVAIDSTEAPLWYNLGVSLAATQDVAGAAAAYERTLAIDSTNVGAWNNLGTIYGGTGRLEEARHAYAKAVEIEPNSLQARMNLALAYLRLGDRTQAAAERQVIQRMNPEAAKQLTRFFQEQDAKPAPQAGSKAPRR